LPPHGIEHHYAPLAVITAAKKITEIPDLRRELIGIAQPVGT
jgi:hypothetical protein